jgi:hypothetical protein
MKAASRMFGGIGMAVAIFVMTCAGTVCRAEADGAGGLMPAAYNRGIVPLTKGSSTTIQSTTGQARSMVTVLALGQGTLKVTLTKKDTINDVVSILLIGYPAEPAFVPGFGITPADVAVSAAVTDAFGGYGIFFIITTINSNETYANSLALKLE